MSKRKQRPALSPPTHRALQTSVAPRSERYPTVAALSAVVLERARGLCDRFVLAGAAVGIAVVATGCEPPQCQPTRLGEVRVHGDTALTDVGSFQLKDAASELGVGFGIVPHPFISAPGEMIPVSAVPLPVAPIPAPPSDVDS